MLSFSPVIDAERLYYAALRHFKSCLRLIAATSHLRYTRYALLIGCFGFETGALSMHTFAAVIFRAACFS